MSNTVALILLLLGGAGSAGVLLLGGWSQKQEKRERLSWTTAQGTVKSFKSVERGPTGPDDWGSGIYDAITIKYSYEVGGKRYSGKQSWSTPPGPSVSYGPGTQVTVYYNPKDPKKATIRLDVFSYRSVGGVNFMGAVLALSEGLIVFGLLALVFKAC